MIQLVLDKHNHSFNVLFHLKLITEVILITVTGDIYTFNQSDIFVQFHDFTYFKVLLFNLLIIIIINPNNIHLNYNLINEYQIVECLFLQNLPYKLTLHFMKTFNSQTPFHLLTLWYPLLGHLLLCSWRWHCSIKYPSSIFLLWTIHLILVHELHSNNNNCNRSRPLLVNSLNWMPFHQTHFPLISRFYYSLISTHVTEKLFPPSSFIQLSCHGAYDGAS